MLDFLNQRRSIRTYSEKNIDSDKLTLLLNAASQSSNTGNMQAYSVIVSTNVELKKQLAPTHFNQAMVVNAPVVLTFCADFNRVTKWCEQRNAVPGFNNFQSFMASAIDAIIFAQTFAIAAESEGMGICYLGTTTYNAGEIIDILKIPKLVVPVTTLTLGYPLEETVKTDRLPLASVVHNELYTDFSNESIDALYAEKEANEIYKKFISDNSKETLAQVFTEVRYTQKNNEFFSEKFLSVLRNQGFMV